MPRFAARTDLPTPPLPPPMAMMRRPGISAPPISSAASSLGESSPSNSTLFVYQLRVPIGSVDQPEEGKPLAVSDLAAARPREGAPARAHRLTQQAQADLDGRARSLAQVAGDAAADDVLPGGAAALGARHDV